MTASDTINSQLGTIQALVARGRAVVGRATATDRRSAVEQIADTIGCILAGGTHPSIGRLARQVDAIGGDGPWRGVTGSGRTRGLHAVVIDSAAAHLDEFDSVHPASGTVPSGIVVPAAVAVARRVGATGHRLVDAVLAGYEVMIEAALVHGGNSLYRRNWWPSLVFGSLGSAMATAVLLELDDDTSAAALALAAGGTGGLLSADRFADGHYWHFGLVAARGIEAGYGAAAGMCASTSLLDAPASRAFGQTRAVSPPSTPGPHLAACVFKQAPCSMPFQPVVQALSAVSAHERAGDVAEVDVGVPAPLLSFVSDDVDVDGPPEAAASAAHVVHAALRGSAEDPRSYRSHDRRPADPPVRITADARAVAPDGGLAAVITIQWLDGARLERVEAFAPPRSVDAAKYRRNLDVGEVDGPPLERLLSLDTAAPVAELFPAG